jgi:dolichol-phosphate mannosyltransferase
VYAVRKQRKGESFFKLFTAKVFYRLLQTVANIDIPIDTGDFRLISRRAAQALLLMPEQRRYVRGMISWVGFKQTGVYYERDHRLHGETHYSFRKMLRFAMDGITSFSYLPLYVSSYLGTASLLAGCLLGGYAAVRHWFYGSALPSWLIPSSLGALFCGVQLLMIGVLGEYLGQVLNEIKKRPLYIVQETLNCER